MTPSIGHDTEPGDRRIRCEEQPPCEGGLELPVEEHQPAPTFTLRSDSGEDVSLAELRGKPVVLNFWASWCQPCVAEHPLLVEAADRYREQVAFIGVVPSEDTAAAVDRFTRRFGRWGPVYHDADGKVSIVYGVFKLPETYFVSSDGKIVSKVSGPLDETSLRANLEAVLLSGYGESTVTGAGNALVTSIGGFYAFKRGSAEFKHLEKEVRRCTGRNIERFQSEYAGHRFVIGD